MNAADAHTLLLTCQAPARAFRDFSEAVAADVIPGTATVIYNRDGQIHEGAQAKLHRYWRRIEAAAQLGSVFTDATADLPVSGDSEAVRLTQIRFADEAVESFMETRRPTKSTRGKKRKQDDWTPFWIAAIKLAKAQQLNVGNFETSTDLTDKLHMMMGATLDEQTIKPFVSQIYHEVVTKSASELEKACADRA